ncbi:hypothetical protein QFC24_005788 [Naganishia onofrii]|uniref:Uncharacterized protein n=1 Tax=Naganishia onofrii TaxID=1851511 RepID=A0ACC2X5Y6_9TREE|nr:hypothetical protein QFC24_005788 [Naganishia onofrii]
MSNTTTAAPSSSMPTPTPTPAPTAAKPEKQRIPLMTHLVAGGLAGLAEACVWLVDAEADSGWYVRSHPLDTVKVRMQLSKSRKARGLKPLGPWATAQQIVARETPMGLYKGIGAVVTGIVPKMAIRFASFEAYKNALSDADGKLKPKGVFLAGLLAGATEAVLVVSPMEVVKIRLQAQQHSLADPLDIPKYRYVEDVVDKGLLLPVWANVEMKEGLSTLYRGVALTALRQATNQGVNFTAYQEFKRLAKTYQPQYANVELPSWQTMILGLVSGAMGPFSNAPIDTIKTRIQKASKEPGETALSRLTKVTVSMFKEEGPAAFYKGILPRVMRVAPGQAIVFTVSPPPPPRDLS